MPFEPSFPFGNIGNPATRQKTFGEIPGEFYFELKKRNLRFGGIYNMTSPGLVIVDPEIVRCIMSKDFQNFSDRGEFESDKHNPLADHMFSATGAKWRLLRKKLTPTFTSGKMKMMFSILFECSGPLIKSMEQKVANQTPIDIKDMLGCFTTDVIGSCAFGLECKSFEEEKAEFRKQGRRFFAISTMQAFKNAMIVAVPRVAELLRFTSMSKDQIQFFLDVVRSTIDYREKNNYERNDFFQLLMDIKKKSELEEGTSFTFKDFAAHVFLFFTAGFETSATTMTFTFYELARNPEIQKKVREEVNEVLRRHDGKLSYDAIQDMKLLNCVVNGSKKKKQFTTEGNNFFLETLRLYPPVPVLLRRCTEDFKIPESDVVIEKGIRAEIPVFAMQRDPEHFPEPEKYNPDRFSEKNKANITPYTYLPFGDGPRNCIGKPKNL